MIAECKLYGVLATRARQSEENEDEEKEEVEKPRGLDPHRSRSPHPVNLDFSAASSRVLSPSDDQNNKLRARCMSLLRTVIDFEAPSAEQVGVPTARFWRVFQQFAEQLLEAEDAEN
ncbi:hypothetical protein F4678DRAFT_483147 [Xylaria arbuscula]|nr:hypothetical protein F4678DRAFT_483147 [Xylaria arbuscula]